ncbi:alanine racemase C-terminal domain-containing protein [Microbacterium sp. GXF7504]
MISPRALRAEISSEALLANARLHAGPDAVADLRRDAYGHGVGTVARALAAAGVRRAVLDPIDTTDAAAVGLEVVATKPTLDPRDLYGLPGGTGRPAMRLVGTVLSLKPLRAGEGVSYNATHVAAADTTVALVSGGYGQGVVRAIGNRAHVTIGGVPHPIVGRVAMDVCMIDVGEAPVQVDDPVVYFGGAVPGEGALADWERITGLRATEIVCTLGLHVAREETA